MAVVAPSGVVGRITQPSARASLVQLIVDRNAAAGAVIERTRVQGIVVGVGDGSLRMDFAPATGDVWLAMWASASRASESARSSGRPRRRLYHEIACGLGGLLPPRRRARRAGATRGSSRGALGTLAAWPGGAGAVGVRGSGRCGERGRGLRPGGRAGGQDLKDW
jgi:hypothetical protein